MVPADEMAPATGTPPAVTMNVAAAIVAEFMASLKVTEIVDVVETFVEPSIGTTAVTVGGVVSGADAVVKDDVKLAAMALPALSMTPVVTVTVYRVAAARLAEGVKV